MRITIEKRTKPGDKSKPKNGSKYPFTIELPDNTTVDELKAAVHNQVPTLHPDRQRLTFGEKKTALSPGKTLASYEINDGDTVFVKDLGLQIGWRTVFIIEYFGPIFFHYIIYNFQDLFYGKQFEHSEVQRRAYLMIILHFIKRELETVFVHRFSHGTMPFFNVFKNSFHYHVLSGINIAYWIYSPSMAQNTLLGQKLSDPMMLGIWSGIYLFAEVSNLITHINLRSLRPPGTRVRKIPYGYGFDWVSCPNYFFEIIAWIAISSMTRSLSCLLFVVVAVVQMYIWAIKKHKQYKHEFPDYPKSRKAIFPFIA